MDRVLAIVTLRYRLATRKMRGLGGKLNMAGWILWTVLGVTVALVASIGVGILTHVMVEKGPEASSIAFVVILWAAAIFGGVVPVLRGAIDQGFDATPFVQYPISRLRLYAITLGATGLSSDLLITYPTLASMTLMGVLLAGAPALPGLLLVFLFALSLAIWSNLFSLVAVSLLRSRRAREALIIVGLGSLILFWIVPMILEGDAVIVIQLSDPPWTQGGLAALKAAAQLFPPSLAAKGLAALPGGLPEQIWTPIFYLGVWCFAGALLGYWVFARFHLAEPRVRVAQQKTEGPRTPATSWLSFDRGPLNRLPTGIKAVASKDLRYLFRSVTGRFSLVVGPAVVVLVSMTLGKQMDKSFFGIEPARLMFFGIMFYAGLITSNFSGNAFGWDSDGVKSYFLSPVTARQVLLGKSIAVWIYDALLIVIVMALWCAMISIPDPITLSTGILIFASIRLAQSAVGVSFSVRYPLSRDISSAKSSPAPLVIWTQLGVVLVTTSLISILLTVPTLLGWEWLQPVVLAGLIVALIVLYSAGLKRGTRLLEERRDQLIEALKSVR